MVLFRRIASGPFILVMSTESTLIEQLFAAGSHYGFSKSRRHPSVAPYLFGTKDGSDIFDLEKSVALIENAKQALEEAGKNGKTVLFVGTKEEAKRIVEEQAKKAEQPYVVNRWIGGILTNFSEIKKRIARLKELVTEKESGELDRKYTKKERVVLSREYDKLMFNFGGLQDIERMPDLLVVVDPRHDAIAVQEAADRKLPVVAIMSSDCNAKPITYPVLVNDTLQSSITLALSELVAAYKAGKAAYTPPPARDTRSGDRRRTPARA